MDMTIGSTPINPESAPYVIAEIGVNHEGSIELAMELVDQAWRGGANAAKFQTYKAETLASVNSPAYWDLESEPTTSQFELFKKYDAFSEAEYKALAEHCKARGIDFMSTPFDHQAVDMLEPLVPAFKIASADITNVPLLRRVAATGKPAILSTGAAGLDEISAAVEELSRGGCEAVALLHCVLEYPCPYENANLGMIGGLRRAFPGKVVGYSDHTRPDPAMMILSAAYLKGARIIEKHFTHDKTLPGNDHYHAMNEADLRKFLNQVALLSEAEGAGEIRYLESEESARLNARRSIVLARSLDAGELINELSVICKRPGTGISPQHWDEVIGMTTVRQLEADHVLQWEDLAPGPE